MKRLVGTMIAVGMCAGMAQAADFDGSKNLLCAPAKVVDCAEGLACVEGMPQELGAPPFLRIDFAGKTVTGTHLTSPVKSIENASGQVLLQGTEQGLGWTITIDSATGRMFAALAGHQGAIVMIGSCTPY